MKVTGHGQPKVDDFDYDAAHGRVASHATVSYRAFARQPTSCINWIASLLLILLLLFTTSVNIFYRVQYGNVVTVAFPDIYAAHKEWLFGSDQTGSIDFSLVHDFIHSDNVFAASRMKTTLLNTHHSAVNATTPCITVVDHDAGSLYAFCDRFNASEMPAWAQDFDALILQTIYLATIEQHAQGHKATPFVGVAQGFRNNRTGWYQQDSIGQFYCTTKQLAEPSKEAFTPRVLFTKAHGVLRNVECALPTESNTNACKAIKGREAFVLFDDGTGIIQEYEVMRTESGEYFILSPYSTYGSIGERTTFVSSWPIDDCLYLRGDSIGWLGAGRSTYQAQIPTLALAAKLQLIGMLLVVWIIKFRCVLHRAHHALFELSRFGGFVIFVAQLLLSAYYEQVIMRTIYSWKRTSVSDWLLFLYIESTIALASTLLALLLLRIAFHSSICQVCASMSMFLPIMTALTEILVAQLDYSSYTVNNGLLARPHPDCKPGESTCALARLNHLHFVVLLSMVPVLMEAIRGQQAGGRRLRMAQIAAMTTTQLTRFEMICLDKCSTRDIVCDCDDPYVDINGVRHVRASLISACGFTMIKDRFLVRTKDLIIVLAANLAIRGNSSVVVWPLQLCDNDTMSVSGARRVLLRDLRDVRLQSLTTHGVTSLLVSDEHPLS